MFLVLEGRIITPIISKRTKFSLMGCKVQIKNPSRRYYNKITTGKPMYPYSFVGYLGTIELIYECKSKAKAKQKLKQLLEIEHIGKFIPEGMGLVKWLTGSFKTTFPWMGSKKRPSCRLRIRKGLPHNLPDNIKQLIRYALLHDFTNTSNHKSKIYIEPELEDLEQLRKHHDKTENPKIQLFQKYDHLAAIITRNIRSPKTNRYNWSSTSNIDFEKLAREIEEVSKKSIGKLYEYIYQNKELGQLNESLQHGHTSLRSHLLIIANLIVQDVQRKKL